MPASRSSATSHLHRFPYTLKRRLRVPLLPKKRKPIRAEKTKQKAMNIPRVLLVEDHAMLASVRRRFLTAAGYRVAIARDGLEARRKLLRQHFDLVITDSCLPKLSGWQVASLARSLGVPVILNSGYPLPTRREHIAAQGVDFFCPKPCSPAQLLSLIEKALSKHRRKPAGCGSTKDAVRKPRPKM